MARSNPGILVFAAAGVALLAALVVFLLREGGGNPPAFHADGEAARAAGAPRSEAASAERAAPESNPNETAGVRAAAAPEEGTWPDVGATVLVRGRLIVRETGRPPKNAVVGVHTGRDELDNAWLIARAGGKAAYERLRLSGELELLLLDAGGRRPTFRSPAREDGTFAVRVPKKALRFTLEVLADDAASSSAEWYFLGEATLRDGVTLFLDEAGALEGTLVDETGVPVKGGWLALQPARAWTPGLPFVPNDRIARGDAEGRFAFRGLPVGDLALAAIAEGSAAAEESNVAIEAGKTTTRRIVLRPEVPLEGAVVDEAGKGFGGVTVRLYGRSMNIPNLGFGIAKSDSEGRLRWRNLAAGAYQCILRPGDRRVVDTTSSVSVPLGAGDKAPRFVLEAGRFLAGRVLDADGKPAAAARLWCSAASPEGSPAGARRTGGKEGFSGPDGTFRVEGLPEGPLSVSATLEGVSTASKTNIPHDTADVEIRLIPKTGVAGTVVDAATRAPIPLFVVVAGTTEEAERFGGRFFGGRNAEKPIASPEGAFDLGGLAPGSYLVRASAPGYCEAEVRDVTVRAGEVASGLVLALAREATIVGKVVDALTGEPVPRAEVEFVDAEESEMGIRFPGERARSDGAFELHGRKAARGRVVASHEKHVEASSPTVELQPGQRLELAPLALGRGGVAEGIAIGRDGALVPRAQVQAYFSGGETALARPRHAYRNVSASEDGFVRLEGLVPGEWTISAQPAARGNDWQASQNLALTTKVTIVEGRVTPIVFTPPKGGGCTVVGRITRGGKPISDGNVNLWRERASNSEEDGSSSPSLGASLGSNGEFRIEHVLPGKHHFGVGLWGEGGFNYNAQVEIPNVPEHRLDVDLPAGGEIRGRVTRRSDGKGIVGIAVSAFGASAGGGGSTQASATTGSDGAYAIKDVAPGRVAVQAEAQRWGFNAASEAQRYLARSESVTVVEGATVTLDFVLDDGATAVVEVVDPDGKPVPNAFVNVIPKRPPPGSSGAWANTNDLGVAKVQGIAPGRAFATVQVPGYPPARSEEFDAALGAEARVRLKLARGLEVLIRLRGPDGAALPLESVVLQSADGAPGGNAFVGNPGQPKDGTLRLATQPGAYKGTFRLIDERYVEADVTIAEAPGTVVDVKATKVPDAKK